MIVGIDEVGRGCLAGPLCVAAVLLGDTTIEGLTDSKLLSTKKRQIYAEQIKQQAASIGIGWVSAKDIDKIGLSRALKHAAKGALDQITAQYNQIIIDGTIKLVDDPKAVTMKKADLLISSVSAASIIAKVARDTYMNQVDNLFPNYGFARHVGYGTAAHLQALKTDGPSSLHRLSFAPLASPPDQLAASLTPGQLAESKAVAYLKRSGYEIIETNWKTKRCEIDIIAKKQSVMYFVEVKYRKSDSSGQGMAYITKVKQRQMRFAAELWLARSEWKDEARLAAIELGGGGFKVSNWLPSID